MKRFLLFLSLSISAWCQVQTVPNTTMPTARTILNQNFTWLTNNKTGLSECFTGQFATQTTSAGVNCGWVDWSVLTGKPSTFAPSAHASSHGSAGSDPLSLNASQVTAGTFAIGLLPTGTTSSTVSLGNHTHAYSTLTSVPSTFAPSAHASSHGTGQADAVSLDAAQIGTGTFAIGRIPTGSSSSTVSLGNHTHTYSSLTSIPSTFAPSTHASSHQNGGADEVGTATPAANAIPKAGSGGRLAVGWLGSGTPDGTKFLRDDGTFAVPAGGSSAAGSATAIQMSDGSGHLTASGNATLGGGLGISITGDSTVVNNGNFHRAIDSDYRPDLAGLNFGYPDEVNLNLYTGISHGFNDDIQSGASSKLTAIGILNNMDATGAGQRFGMGIGVNCYGMGDCYGHGETVYQWGGLNASGDEGTGHKRDLLSQGVYLAKGNISSVPTQSQCVGTLAQDVTRSTNGAAQAVNFTKTSGAGTCQSGEWVDVQRGAIYADARHEVTQLTANYSGGQITAVFESNHDNGAAVSPATVLNVDNTSYFGELRYLVNMSGPRHTGTLSSVSGVSMDLNDAPAPNVVGGDATLPGMFIARQDDYVGYPFGQGYLCTGTITASITASGSPQSKAFTRLSGGCLSGYAITINPGQSDQEVVTLTADALSGTFTAVFTKNHTSGAKTTDGADWDHTLHAIYGIQGIGTGGACTPSTGNTCVFVAHLDAAGAASYRGKATAGGDYVILPGARIYRIIGGQVILENNSFAWSPGDLVENAISSQGNVADTNFFQWWMPGAALYDAQNILNTGARTFGAAQTIASRMAVGSNSDAPWAWENGVIISGAKTGISINNPLAAGIHFGNDDDSLYNANITWNNSTRLGTSNNPLTTGYLSMSSTGSGVTRYGTLDFGDSSSFAANGHPILRWTGIFSVQRTSSFNLPPQIELVNDYTSTDYNAWRFQPNFGSQELTFHWVDTSGPTDISAFGVNSSGPFVPVTATATSGHNYGSTTYGFGASLWNGTSATATNQGAILISPTGNGTGDPLRYDFVLPANCSGHFYYGFSNRAMSVTQDGKLSIGLIYPTSDCYSYTQEAVFDPTSITANAKRTYTLPDASGTLALTGASQNVSFGTVTVNGGSNTVYRCATAGATLPVGSLTINASACGTTADTGLRVN